MEFLEKYPLAELAKRTYGCVIDTATRAGIVLEAQGKAEEASDDDLRCALEYIALHYELNERNSSDPHKVAEGAYFAVAIRRLVDQGGRGGRTHEEYLTHPLAIAGRLSEIVEELAALEADATPKARPCIEQAGAFLELAADYMNPDPE